LISVTWLALPLESPNNFPISSGNSRQPRFYTVPAPMRCKWGHSPSVL